MRYRALSITIAGLVLLGCSGFPTSINNIEQGKKTRPLSVVLDKPEAAPGDTVGVTLNFYTPDPADFTLNWDAVLDYRLDMMSGKGVENNVISLDQVMFDDTLVYREDNLVTHNFRFVVPESTLLQSSNVAEKIPIPDIDPALLAMAGIPTFLDTMELEDGTFIMLYTTRTAMDSVLKANTLDLSLLPPDIAVMAETIIDLFVCNIRLKAKIRSDIKLDVVRNLTVRYSSRYNTSGVNLNPQIHGLAIIKVQGSTFNPEEISEFPHDTIYLYNRDHPALEQDTVAIDTGHTYFLEVYHDSGQVFYYMREENGVTQIDTNREEHFYRWFFSNMDDSEMPQDSLILIMTLANSCIMLPPVDTDMHNFRLYVVVRDDRAEWGVLVSPGIAYADAKGYFKYTEAYKKGPGKF